MQLYKCTNAAGLRDTWGQAKILEHDVEDGNLLLSNSLIMQEREQSDRGILLLSGCFAYQINDASMKFESWYKTECSKLWNSSSLEISYETFNMSLSNKIIFMRSVL